MTHYLTKGDLTVEFKFTGESVVTTEYPTGKRWLGRKNTITVAQAREKWRRLVQAGFERW